MSERADEGRHDPGPEPGWEESWYVDFSDQDGVGGFLRLGLRADTGRAWVWACFVEKGGLVLVRDHDVPPPRGEGLEVRAGGLWADLVCETAMSHWTFGLEAFGVSLDDPAEAYRGERGDRVPLGFDLEWEALAPPFDHPGPETRSHAGHYQHPGRVHGEILVGDRRLAFDGTGERDHAWGPRDWWGVGWHWTAFRFDDGRVATSVARPDRPGSEHATGYLEIDGEEAHPVLRAEVTTQYGAHELPSSARYAIEGGVDVDAEVLAVVPILVPTADGVRISRLPRALCRFTGTAGTGTGWAEWLQPA